MSVSWMFCPHCRTGFQVDGEQEPPDHCPACQKALASIDAWYCARKKQKVGPLSWAQLQQLARTGELQPDDMIHQEGTPSWVKAGSIEGLFARVESTTPEVAKTGPHDPANAASVVASSPLSMAPPHLPGYEIVRKLGQGGMGVVYLARDLKLQRLVALKTIRSGGDASDEETARFAREAVTVAQLQHPNIVQVHQTSQADGLTFFAMEYVEGGSLAQRLADSPLPPRNVAQLVRTLALAVHAAHERGVIHRDLKPANVLLAGGRYLLRAVHAQDHRLWPGQETRRRFGADTDRRHHGHPLVHGAGASRGTNGAGRPGCRRICAGRHSLRMSDGQAAVPCRHCAGYPGTGAVARPGAAPPAAAADAA